MDDVNLYSWNKISTPSAIRKVLNKNITEKKVSNFQLTILEVLFFIKTSQPIYTIKIVKTNKFNKV